MLTGRWGSLEFGPTRGGNSHAVIALIGSLLAIMTLALVVMACVALAGKARARKPVEEEERHRLLRNPAERRRLDDAA